MFARIVNFTLLVALVIAIPLSHDALSAKKKATKKKTGPPPKVAICHFPDDSTVGHVIEVSENAVPAHIAKHGDCTSFVELPTGGCQCVSCTELCVAALERCLADCPPIGTGACQADCQAAFNQCDVACHGNGNTTGGG